MSSIQDYLKKYSEMFKSRKLRRSTNRSTKHRSITPKSFLIKLSPKNNQGRTATEEIFNTENKIFFEKIVNSRNSSPIKTPQPSRNVLKSKNKKKSIKPTISIPQCISIQTGH